MEEHKSDCSSDLSDVSDMEEITCMLSSSTIDGKSDYSEKKLVYDVNCMSCNNVLNFDKFIEHEDIITCDICNEDLRNGDLYAGCFECDFDICFLCANNIQRKYPKRQRKQTKYLTDIDSDYVQEMMKDVNSFCSKASMVNDNEIYKLQNELTCSYCGNLPKDIDSINCKGCCKNLKFEIYKNDNVYDVVCDICNTLFENGEKIASCQSCNTDICIHCASFVTCECNDAIVCSECIVDKKITKDWCCHICQLMDTPHEDFRLQVSKLLQTNDIKLIDMYKTNYGEINKLAFENELLHLLPKQENMEGDIYLCLEKRCALIKLIALFNINKKQVITFDKLENCKNYISEEDDSTDDDDFLSVISDTQEDMENALNELLIDSSSSSDYCIAALFEENEEEYFIIDDKPEEKFVEITEQNDTNSVMDICDDIEEVVIRRSSRLAKKNNAEMIVRRSSRIASKNE